VSDVTVTLGELANGQGFYIEDDGSGIDPSDAGQVCESGYSTAEDGTGLGLAIVDRAASAHGWKIAGSDSGAGGARFEVTSI
jgi:signal transduction histidine kinase